MDPVSRTTRELRSQERPVRPDPRKEMLWLALYFATGFVMGAGAVLYTLAAMHRWPF